MKYHLEKVFSKAVEFESDLVDYLVLTNSMPHEEARKEVLCVQVACYLHDVLEDTWASYNDIKDNFNTRIADLVYLVTDELGKNRTERALKTYPKISSDPSAIFVKLCDRCSNLKEAIDFGPVEMGKAYLKQDATFKYALYKEGQFPNLWKHYNDNMDLFRKSIEE